MTRENKVALVIGFALVLLVGILISDHLSKAQTQRSAELVPASSRRERPVVDRRDLVDLHRDVLPPSPAPPADTPASRPVAYVPPVRLPDTPEPPPATPQTPRTHRVLPGESLSEIALRYYGTAAATAALAGHNGLEDPDTLRAGTRLRIPTIHELTGETPAPAGDAGSYRTYRVRPGDSLSGIADRFSTGGWQRLYELNRDVIHDPDNIQAGTVIRVPAS